MTDRDLLLAVDGGGTRCRVRIADRDGTKLAEVEGGPSNTRLGTDLVFSNILDATERALASAGLGVSCLPRLHAGLGLAGLPLERERKLVHEYPHPFASMHVETDAHIACLGAHAGKNGAVLILGTGSCGCAIIDCEEHTVGGWGFEISDYASGAYMGRKAVRQALLSREGLLPPSEFADKVFERFGASPEEAVVWAEKATPRDWGGFAPLVFEYAERGDPLAENIRRRTGEHAALMVQALVDLGAADVCLIGGVAQALKPHLPDKTLQNISEPLGDTLDGALILATRGLTNPAA